MASKLAKLAAATLLAMAAFANGADLASVVPEDAVIYLEVRDAPGLWSDFQASGLRDIVRAVPQAEFGLNMATAFVQQQTFHRLGVAWKTFAEKFLRHVGVVITEVGGPQQPSPVVLLEAAGRRAELAELLKNTIEPKLMMQQNDLAVADEKVGDVALRVLKAKERSIAYGFLGDILAVGEPDPVRKLIDARERPLLANNASFKAVRERLATPKGIALYVNLGKIIADHAEQLKANPELAANLDRAGLSAIKWVAASSAFDGRGVRDKLFLYTGEKKVGLLSLLGGLTPGQSQAASLLPPECPLLLSLNFKDGQELWGSLLRFMEETADIEGLMRLDEGRQRIHMYFGIRFDEEVVGALGGEVFLAADPTLVSDFIEKGREIQRGEAPFILGLRVAKPELLKTTIHKFVTSQPLLGQGVERAVENYRGHEIKILTVPARANKPAYAFVGDYLLVARTADVIRKCIDAKLGQNNLASRPRYRVVASKVPAKHNALLFADLQTLALAATTKGKPPEEGKPVPIEVTLAGQLRGACATITSHKDGVMVEIYSRPGALPLVAALRAATRVAKPPVPAPAVEAEKPTDF